MCTFSIIGQYYVNNRKSISLFFPCISNQISLEESFSFKAFLFSSCAWHFFFNNCENYVRLFFFTFTIITFFYVFFTYFIYHAKCTSFNDFSFKIFYPLKFTKRYKLLAPNLMGNAYSWISPANVCELVHFDCLVLRPKKWNYTHTHIFHSCHRPKRIETTIYSMDLLEEFSAA